MTSYVDDNPFPKIILTEQASAPATPAAGTQMLWIKSSDHLAYLENSGGTSTAIGGGGGGGAMTQIQKITNGSTTAMTFSSIPGTYNSLLLVLHARAASASTVAWQLMQFNGDTGGNYDWALYGINGSAFTGGTSAGGTSLRAALLPDSTATANFAGAAQILIPNYASTSFFKDVLVQTWGTPDVTNIDFGAISVGGQWHSTAAITSLSLINTMLTSSVGTLYGIT